MARAPLRSADRREQVRMAWLVPLFCLLLSEWVWAQEPTIEESKIPALPGGESSSMGLTPGAGGPALGVAPGAGGSALTNSPVGAGVFTGRPGVSYPKGVPLSTTTPGIGASPTALQMPVTAPEPQPVGAVTSRFYGSLDMPATEDDGPPEGLTLDRAIDITLDRSLDLKQKFVEIPMARADTLQASLRANPIFYQDGQLLQYRAGEYNRSRPGGPQQFDTNITIPLDVSFKRKARTEVATRAERVLEAQYQEAVRQRIDDVYDAFVMALSARQTYRYAQQSVKGLLQLQGQTQKLLRGGVGTQIELDRVENQVRVAKLGLVDAEANYRRARIALGSLMNLPVEEGAAIEIRGSIDVQPPPLPPLEDLRRIALLERPDIQAFRLGVHRAHADVKLARANAFSDVYVLWQPYTFQDNSPYGVKSATSWALGVTVPLPIYNRNQGGILRAKLNVDQSRLQLADVERQLLVEVEMTTQEFETARRLVADLRGQIMPDARAILTKTYDLRAAGQVSFIDVINAQLDFNDKVKQYLDTAIRYRRSMLSLNTAVGKRIMP